MKHNLSHMYVKIIKSDLFKHQMFSWLTGEVQGVIIEGHEFESVWHPFFFLGLDIMKVMYCFFLFFFFFFFFCIHQKSLHLILKKYCAVSVRKHKPSTTILRYALAFRTHGWLRGAFDFV